MEGDGEDQPICGTADARRCCSDTLWQEPAGVRGSNSISRRCSTAGSVILVVPTRLAAFVVDEVGVDER
jgi:hypothetical protein